MAKWNLPPMQLPYVATAPLKIATSTDDLKKGVGSYALAVVAPKEGPIDVKAGTPVILVVKNLMESPTVKKLLRVVYAAWIVFALYVGFEIVKAGDLWTVDWSAVAKAGVNAAVISGLAGYGISLKKSDNDPVKS